MNTETATKTEGFATDKVQLYDKIGEHNVRIVALEHEIPVLEDQLRRDFVQEDLEHKQALQLSLREKRTELFDLQTKVKHIRVILLKKLRLEVQQMEYNMERESIAPGELARCREILGDYREEIERLEKLVA